MRLFKASKEHVFDKYKYDKFYCYLPRSASKAEWRKSPLDVIDLLQVSKSKPAFEVMRPWVNRLQLEGERSKQQKVEKIKASIRAKVEHPLRFIK